MIMLTEFKNYIERHHLIEKGDKILLALSGGVDSMVLARLLLEANVATRKRDDETTVGSQLTAHNSIAFAHCNFHLRGEDSDRDEKFVTEFAKENDIPIYIKHFDTETYAKENSLSIEMAARELRYAWFEKLKNTHNINKVALAHHGDDQIETFFINFLRGSGIKGLKGMKPKNDFYIRPLLWSNRNQIETYAKENGIKWVEDYTNKETIYLRNKIRHQIIPILDEIKTNARQSLNFSIDCLSSENELYRNLIEEKIANIEFVDGDYRSIDVKYFLENKNGKQLLFEWVRKFGFNYSQAESMYEAMTFGKSGTVWQSVGTRLIASLQRVIPAEQRIIASVQKDKIEIFKERGEEEIIVSGTWGLKDTGNNSETLRLCDFTTLRLKSYNKDSGFKLMKNPALGAQFDMEKIKFPLKLRHWRKGDKFKPLGMKGSKLLSDFFNDLGFSAYQKQNVWIMEDANGLILWVVGHRINDKVKILDPTKVIFQCDLES